MSTIEGMIRQSTENPLTPALYDWQEEHCSKLVKSVKEHGVAKDGSDTGTGKTIVALEVARRTGLKPFVVCPKSVIPAWKEWMEKFGYDTEHVINYEKLKGGKTPYGWIPKRGFFRWKGFDEPSEHIVIFDEDHRMKGHKSLNSKILISAKALGFQILLLGATSCSNPLEMRAMGYALDLHGGKDWWQWCQRNGCKKGRFSLEFTNPGPTLKRFHKHIYEGRGSRIRIKDLPEGAFPENLIIPQGYQLEENIDAIYDSMKSELLALEERIEDGDAEDNPLIIQLRARQEIELLKVPTFVELAKDAYAEGASVAIFVNFRDTLEAIAQRLSDLCPLSIVEGGQADETRESMVAKFQSNESRIIVCMIQAGGVGINLHDEHGEHPRVSLISPGFSAIDLKQTLGRIHRAGGQSSAIQKIVFADNSVEMRVCNLLKKKLSNLDLVNDDDLNPIFV